MAAALERSHNLLSLDWAVCRPLGSAATPLHSVSLMAAVDLGCHGEGGR